MQSGISASEELHAAFKELLASTSQRGLLVSISKSPEALVPSETITSTSSDFSTDLSNLEPHIKDNVATYVLLREELSHNSGKCVAITFVPEKAPVRSKMLFASTRLTLVRELGTEHFTSTIFATNPAELTSQGWSKHLAHESLSAPMTDEEAANATLREAEASESTGTSTRRGGHVSRNITLPVMDEGVAALDRLKKGEIQLVQLGIDIPSETLILGDTTESLEPAGLGAAINPSTPRYSFYCLADGEQGKVLFIYTCPSNASIKEKMLYAASRISMVSLLAPQYGLEIVGKLEASDPIDVVEEDVLKELGVATKDAGDTGAAARGGFARPKRPGRR